MDDERLQLIASSLAAEATMKITAELGPRALPMGRETYIATAEQIAQAVIGPDWEWKMTMDFAGRPYIFIGQYRLHSDQLPRMWHD